MKRIALLVVALAVMVALAFPVTAGQFSDLPEGHWAYDAVNKLVAAGIMQGYTDGTFQGKNTLNRFEIAVMLSKLLDQVAAERALLAERVDALENGLTAGQAEDAIAIFKSLIAKANEQQPAPAPAPAPTPAPAPAPAPTPAPAPVVADDENDSLSQAQAEEVATIVEALVMEFKYELQAMGADIDALGTRVDAAEGKIADLGTQIGAVDGKVTATDAKVATVENNLKALDGRVAKLEAPTAKWSGKYLVQLDRVALSGATPYYDPFKLDYDGDGYNNTGAGYDNYYTNNRFRHRLELDFKLKNDNIDTWFGLAGASDSFTGDLFSTPVSLGIEEFHGKVMGNNFTVVADRDQEEKMTSYLFGMTNDDGAYYNGVKATVGSNEYGLYRIEDLDDNGNVLSYTLTAAVKQGLSLGKLKSTLFFGANNVILENNYVAGLATPLNIFGLALNTNAAVQKVDADLAKYFTVNGKKALGPLTVEGNYTLRDAAFVGIQSYGINYPGYDGKVSLNLLKDAITANARYYDYTGTAKRYDVRYGAGAAVKFGPIAASADVDYANNANATDTVFKANRTQASASLTQDIAFLNVATGYKYDQYTDFNGQDATLKNLYVYYPVSMNNPDGVETSLDQFNRGYADLKAKLFVPGLTATANYVYGLDGDVDGNGLTTHKYGLNLTKGIVTLGAGYDLVNANYSASAALDPAAVKVLGFSIDTVASVAAKMPTADLKNIKYDYKAGVDVKKPLNAKSNFTYNFLYDNRVIDVDTTKSLEGRELKQVFGFDYQITDSVTATMKYTDLNFKGLNDADSYKVFRLNGGLTYSF